MGREAARGTEGARRRVDVGGHHDDADQHQDGPRPAVGPDPQSTRQTPPSTAKNTPANQRLPRPEPGIAALLSTAAGPLDSLEVLRRVGLTPLPDGAGDFKLTGHERWPEKDYWKLMGWLRHNGQWVQMALDNGVKGETKHARV